uniref:Membrane transporter protein n=1 Tax=Globisporangium ultimum (strain ATCC 200006 / CBS 805.95 / DAOM BR144) TaxID=431595 RepID=K3WQG7_GLOUD
MGGGVRGVLACVVLLASVVCMEASTHLDQQQLRGTAPDGDPIAAILDGDGNPSVVRKEQDDEPHWEIDTEDLAANAAAFARHEVLGMSLAGLAIFIAAGGGTGGGGVLDPIYILIMKLDAKTAIPLSSITIVGGAIANLLINIRRARSNSTQPLIDWDFILVMQPMLLMGASFGTFINAIAPTWLLCILLVFVLTATGIRTLQKAIVAGRQEWWFPGGRERIALLGVPNSVGGNPRYAGSASSRTTQQHHLHHEMKADIPWKKVGMLFGLFLGIALLSLLQGGKKFASPIGISPDSFLYPIVAFLPTLFLIIFSNYSMRNVMQTFQRQQNPYYVLSPDEIQWTPNSIRYFPILSILAGMVSGMFGIGGGIINGPLLLEIGIAPAAASAMTATTVLFSSSMSSFSYTLLGSLNFGYAVVMLPIGFLMTFIGHVCLLKIVQKFRCPSLIIFSMAIIVLVSAVAMSVESIKELVNS